MKDRGGDLFAEVLLETVASDEARSTRLERFHRAVSWKEALGIWLDRRPGEPVLTRDAVCARLSLDIAAIDRLLGRQLDRVLHHPRFQRLEASWRGLDSLVEAATRGRGIKVRVLSLTWEELAKDIERAIEFDQSQLFKKVYNEEFGTPGGEPFGVLLGDYFVSHRPRPDQRVDDVRVLRGVSAVAAAAFAPFIVGAHPALFGVDSFAELSRVTNLQRIFKQVEYTAWNSLRDSEDARFLAVTLPRILMREPWAGDAGREDGFSYAEDCTAPDRQDYLWGNACYAFGKVLVRAFLDCGWLADIRGVVPGVESGGLVADLCVQDFGLETRGVASKISTELVVSDAKEKEYSDLGLVALCSCHGTPYSAFYATPSLQKPKRFDRKDAQVNSNLSAMLQYILCVARFAHYMKMICRDRSGSYTSAKELEDLLSGWLYQFAISGEDASTELQAEYPLREASVAIHDIPGKPGSYSSVIHLLPHFQLDQMTSSIRLVTEMLSN